MRIIDSTQPYVRLDNIEGYEDLYWTEEEPDKYYEPFVIISIGNISMNLIETYADYLHIMTGKTIEYDIEHDIPTKNNIISFYISPDVPLYVDNEQTIKFKEDMQNIDKYAIQCPDCSIKKEQIKTFGNILFKRIGDFQYVDGKNLENEKFIFLRSFMKMFSDKTINYNREYEETFGFEVLSVVKRPWTPGMDPKTVFEDMKKYNSDSNNKLMIIKNKNLLNLERVKEGQMPIFPYPKSSKIGCESSKYLILRAFIDICNENVNNMPFCAPNRLLELISLDVGFMAPDYKIAEMVYKRIDSDMRVSCVDFDTFDIYLIKYMYILGKQNLRPLLIKSSSDTYCVCHEGPIIEIEDIPDIIFSNELIEYFEDPLNKFYYKEKNITELVKFTFDDEIPLFSDEVFYGNYKNPKTGNYLGYLFWESYNTNFYGIYKSIFGEGYMKSPQTYNAELHSSEKIEISKNEKGAYIAYWNNVEISDEMIIDTDDYENWISAFKRWWSIGLFMTVYGLYYYKKTNIILKHAIIKNDILKMPYTISESYEILKFMNSY